MGDKVQIFTDIKYKVIQNLINNLNPIDSITVTSDFRSTGPCEPVFFNILNLLNKPFKTYWIDYEGHEISGNVTTSDKKIGSIHVLNTYSNHCFRIIYDDKSFYIKIPLNVKFIFIGDVNNIFKILDDSDWSNNPDLDISHLLPYKILGEKCMNQNLQPEPNVFQSFYYDESPQVQNSIEKFFVSFYGQKFIDSLFNPLAKLDSKTYVCKRASEHKVKVPNRFEPSVYKGSSYDFQIKNDTDSDLTVYWIDYNGIAKSNYNINL